MEEKASVSAAELKGLLDEGKVEFIFDLRNRDEFGAWHIDGHAPVDTLNIPQVDFVGEEDTYLDRLPRDRHILTVCAHGDSSRYAAELLRRKGFDAISLEGGMDIWSDYYETHKAADNPDVYQIYRSAKGCICHLAVSGSEAVVIDAARHTEPLLSLIRTLGVTVRAVLDTHLHADHISGGSALSIATGAPYYLNPLDAGQAEVAYRPLQDGAVIAVGRSRLEVVHSPGHTPGSTSFLLDGSILFSGDTLMKTSVGRPDLGGKAEAWAELLYQTLFGRFSRLSDDIVVLPAHAASLQEQDAGNLVRFSMGQARRELEPFRLRDLAAFISHITSTLPENPERYKEIRQVNLGRFDPDEAKRKELEIGKNLCGTAEKTALT